MNFENLVLEKVDSSYYPEIYKWRSDPEAARFNPFNPGSLEDFSTKMNLMESDLDLLYSGVEFKWMIRHEQEIVSVVSLSQINKVMRTADIGYQVNPKFRRQGLGYQVVKILITHVLNNTDLRKLLAFIADKNIGSYRIVEKLGFEQEGLLRKQFIIQGEEVDERLYGLLREDWENL